MFGGLFHMSKKYIFSLNFSFKGEGFVCLCVDWDGNWYFIVNVYSSCMLEGKGRLWREMIDFKHRYSKGEWCIGEF